MQEGSPLWYPGAPLSPPSSRPLAATETLSSKTATTPSPQVSVAKVNLSATSDTQKASPGSLGRPSSENHVKVTPLLSPLSSSSNTPPAVSIPFSKRYVCKVIRHETLHNNCCLNHRILKSCCASSPNRLPFHMIAPAESLPGSDSTFLKVLYDLLSSNILLSVTVPIMLGAIYYLFDPYIGMIFVVCISIYHVLP